MTTQSYGQFCPVAMAAEILCRRWTMVVLRELIAGSTRFNELRRGLSRMSPALLSTRLKELEEAGLIARVALGQPEVHHYHLTEAGRDLRPVVEAMGLWGQRWVQTEPSLRNIEPGLLMWDMRRNLDCSPMPDRRCVIEFLYPELREARRHWWLIVDHGEVDLCSIDPGLDVDLYVVTDLRTMTRIWMGLSSAAAATDDGTMTVSGDPRLADSMGVWLGLSPFAREPKRAAEAVGSG